jgi:hypothetical protein
MIYPLDRYKTGFFRLLITGVLILLSFERSAAQELDYRAQSLYIYKFTKFIYWPQELTSGDFIIGVYGNSPILDELRLMASIKKAAKDQSIVVRELDAIENLAECHIVYVPSSKSRQMRALADEIGNRPILIVAEREGMATKGATISFLVDNYEILKFEVNIGRLEEQKLSISEELIKLGYKL